MTKTKYAIRRLLAMLLVVAFLIQWVPASVFATEAGTTDYTPGDVNGDDCINALDVTLVRRHIAGG